MRSSTDPGSFLPFTTAFFHTFSLGITSVHEAPEIRHQWKQVRCPVPSQGKTSQGLSFLSTRIKSIENNVVMGPGYRAESFHEPVLDRRVERMAELTSHREGFLSFVLQRFHIFLLCTRRLGYREQRLRTLG